MQDRRRYYRYQVESQQQHPHRHPLAVLPAVAETGPQDVTTAIKSKASNSTPTANPLPYSRL